MPMKFSMWGSCNSAISWKIKRLVVQKSPWQEHPALGNTTEEASTCWDVALNWQETKGEKGRST